MLPMGSEPSRLRPSAPLAFSSTLSPVAIEVILTTQRSPANHFLLCSPMPPVWVRPGRPMTIGRGANCELRLAGTMISRQHVRIEVRNGILTVRDLASSNGTRVNGLLIEMAELQAGDTMSVGGWVFSYRTCSGHLSSSTQGDPLMPKLDTAKLGASALQAALRRRQAMRQKEDELTEVGPHRSAAERGRDDRSRDRRGCQVSTVGSGLERGGGSPVSLGRDQPPAGRRVATRLRPRAQRDRPGSGDGARAPPPDP